MARVFIPFSLQELTGGLRELEVPGSNVGDIVEQLERRYPGVREQLIEGNHLRLNITVAVDGEISPMGLLEEVYRLPLTPPREEKELLRAWVD